LRINVLASAGGNVLNKKAAKLAANKSMPPKSKADAKRAAIWIVVSSKG
jgi:hypothetical protein